MKKDTKVRIAIFAVTFILSYLLLGFFPKMGYELGVLEGTVVGIWGDIILNLLGLRFIISLALAMIVLLLGKIVENPETVVKEEKKSEKKK